jgi:hypothetical protein
MNMKFAAIAALGLVASVVMAPRASAADNGFYLGAGITDSDYNIEDLGSADGFNDNSFKVIAGFRPLDWIAVEANYYDLSGTTQDNTFKSKTLSVSGLLIAEIAVVDLYARVGVAKWDADWKSPTAGPVQGGGSSGTFSASDSGWEPTYGIGVGLHFGSFGVRAEYERLDAKMFDSIDTHINTLSLCATWTFL